MNKTINDLYIADYGESLGLPGRFDDYEDRDPLEVSMTGIEMPEDQSVGAYAESVGRTWGEMLRGAIAGTFGASGDIESIIYGIKNVIDREAGEGAADAFLAGMAEPTILPTTERVSEAMPKIPGNEDQEAAGAIGEMLGLGGVINAARAAIIKGSKAVAKAGGAAGAIVAPTAEGATNKQQMIDDLYNEFAITEGDGDKTGAAKTLKRGLTEVLYKKMKKKHGANITNEEASKLYLNESYDGLTAKLKGFDALSDVAKSRILDTAYNMDWNNLLKFKNFSKAVAAGDEEAAMKNLLDTAQTMGMTTRGLAKRRAQNYNMVNPSSKITSVRQMKDGTIKYMKGRNVFFSFKTSGGRFIDPKTGEESKVGTLKVN